MKMCINVAICILLLAACAWCDEIGTSPNGSPISIDQLATRWKTSRESSNTLEVDYFFFRGRKKVSQPPLNTAEIMELIENVRLLCETSDSPQLSDLEALSGGLFPVDLVTGYKDGAWSPTQVLWSGDKSRMDVLLPVPPLAGEPVQLLNRQRYKLSIARVNGIETKFDSINKQISVLDTPSILHILTAHNFVAAYDNAQRFDWKLTLLPDGYIRGESSSLEEGELQFEADQHSGFIRKNLQKSASRTHEVLQYFPTMHDSGTPLPRLTVSIDYHGDDLRAISFCVINAIQIGHPVDDKRFNVEVPAGTLVVKFPKSNVPVSQGGARPPMELVTKPHQDAVSLSRETNFGAGRDIPRTPRPLSSSRSRGILFTVNAIIVISLIVFYPVKRWYQSRKNTS